MKIKQIRIKGFKTLNDVVFTPGRINVFVGANGSGKTTLLEAIGILSAAMTDRVDHNALNRKGIRLSVPELYQSSFKDLARRSSTIGFNIAWQQADDEYEYSVNLNVPSENDNARKDMWRYHSEALLQNGKKLWGRSGASQASYDPYVGFFMLDQDTHFVLTVSFSPIRPPCEERRVIRTKAIPSDCAAVVWRKLSKKYYVKTLMGICLLEICLWMN
ncbi:MAG: AAA family ATPase [Clostridia bacterium]